MTSAQPAPHTNSGMSRDLHAYITNTIIEQLEDGVIPWQKPWNARTTDVFAIPSNLTTGKKYQGINILMLWIANMKHDFATPHWASFKQWQSKDEQVRKGEKGTTIVYYDTIEREEEGEIKKIPFLKSSVVFNKSQLKSYREEALKDLPPFRDRLPLVEGFVANTGAILDHHDGGAYYMPSDDKIVMPFPETFVDTDRRTRQEGYYSVMMHELMHWTAHEKRLNRKFGKSFGNESYAIEELVAEIGAAFLCAELQITQEVKQDHAGYIANWLKVIRDNKQSIVKSASEASKAAQYLQGFQKCHPESEPS